MPYKDPIKAREHCKKYYQENQEKWKNSDGSWKRPLIEKARVYNKKSYYKRHKQVREQQKQKYRLLHPVKYGNCPICTEYRRLVWDHDHQSKLFRDWICSQCNVMLGMAQDKIEIFTSAINYLRRNYARRTNNP